MIENVYRLQVMNMTERARVFHFAVSGLRDARIAGAEAVTVGPAATQAVTVQVLVPGDAGKPGANELHFVISPVDEPALQLQEKTTFLMPN